MINITHHDKYMQHIDYQKVTGISTDTINNFVSLIMKGTVLPNAFVHGYNYQLFFFNQNYNFNEILYSLLYNYYLYSLH